MAINLMGRLGVASSDEDTAANANTNEVEIHLHDGTNNEKDDATATDKLLTNKPDTKDDPEVFLNIYQELKNEIQTIDDCSTQVDTITSRLLKATSNSEEKELFGQLDKLMIQNNRVMQSVKTKLKEQKAANDKYSSNKPGSSVAQWRINQLNTCTRKFQHASNTFQAALNRFNSELKNRQKRHIEHIDNKLSEEEVQNLVSDPARAQNYIQKSFQLIDVGDEMVDRLAEIEQRTEGMQKIYDNLEELRAMWQELNFLISEQQEYLDSIENNVQQTKDYVAQATVNLTQAEKSQRKTRKLQFCALCGCCIILIVAIIVLGGTGVFSGNI